MGKQFIGVTRRLLVIERLSVGQRVARREDMNPSIHIYMTTRERTRTTSALAR